MIGHTKSLFFTFKEKFVQVFREQAEQKRRADAEKMALLTGDPFDPEVC